MSDLGFQLQAGSNIISTFLNDSDTVDFFRAQGITPTKFQSFPKGNSSLGSLVEVIVKQVKWAIYKSIKKYILDYFDFEFLIAQTIHMMNKRPVAFKETLRSVPDDSIPDCITPEMLIKGYDTCSILIIPQLCDRMEGEWDPEW